MATTVTKRAELTRELNQSEFDNNMEAIKENQTRSLENEASLQGVTSGHKGPIVVADTPTEDGIYTPTEESADYTNAGNLSYLPSTTDQGFAVTFIKSGATWTKQRVDLNLDFEPKNTFDATDEVNPSTMKATADFLASETEATPTLGSTKPVQSGGVFITQHEKEVDAIRFYRDSVISKQILFTQQDGNINKDTGAIQISGTWRNTGFIKTSKNDVIKRTSLAYNNTGSGTVALVSYWDENKNFISSLIANLPVSSKHSFEHIENIGFTVFCYTDASGITLELENTGINIQKIDGITDIKDVTGVLREGFIDISGNFNSASTWRTSQDNQTKEGDIFYYSGYTTTGQPQVIGYDVSNNVTILLPYVNPDQLTRAKVVIPANIVRVVASSVADSVDFKLEKEVYLWGEEKKEISNEIEFFMPKNVYGKNGDIFKLNPFGILAKHPVNNDLDIFWNVDESNEKQLIYTPSTETTKEFILNYNGNQLSTTLNVSQSPTNPVNPHYFLHLGDSTVLGVSSASIEGAMVNELSRRLNGTGTALLSGAESPTADNFTNLQFIGTLGNQPVKHEGRGGWSLFNYLNTETLNSVANAFYNPAVSKFDLDYYLTQNNFTNISASGDNLTIILQCTWNSVYKHTKAQLLGWLTEITDLILADKPSAKIVLVGIPNPSYPNKKTFTGDRDVSYEAIMKEAVLPFSKLYQDFSEDVNYSANVDYVDYASVFFPENSYPSIDEKISARHSETYKVYTDYVHQNALGYAQMVDALYYFILNKYC